MFYKKETVNINQRPEKTFEEMKPYNADKILSMLLMYLQGNI
jgi:hypothetical protein